MVTDKFAPVYFEGKIEKISFYAGSPLFPPLIQITLSINRSFDEIPPLVSRVNYPLDESVTIVGQELTRLGVHVYNYDSSLAPEGKMVIKVLLNSDYDYWKELR